jgi:hypothetical protein
MSEPVSVVEHAAQSHAPAVAEAHHPATVAAIPELPFTERQIDQFDADDGDAGRAIGKMLALFFLYTVVAMSIVAWWTFRMTDARTARNAAAASPAHAASATTEGAAEHAE